MRATVEQDKLAAEEAFKGAGGEELEDAERDEAKQRAVVKDAAEVEGLCRRWAAFGAAREERTPDGKGADGKLPGEGPQGSGLGSGGLLTRPGSRESSRRRLKRRRAAS